MSSHNKQVLNSLAELLEALRELIQTDPSSGEVDIGGERKTYQDWNELRGHFFDELFRLQMKMNSS
jgi:hypothetical protein